MNLRSVFFLFFSLLMITRASSQFTQSEEELLAPALILTPDLNYSVEFNLKGLGSFQDQLPFWMYSNQRGRVSRDSHLSSWISGKYLHWLTRDSHILTGAGLLFQDGEKSGVDADELFVHFQNTWLYVTLGKKHRPESYNGISSSNGSILWSQNARAMPGIQIGTPKPMFLSGDDGLGVEGSWNEYWMGNDRFVKGARVHHKNLRLVYRQGDSWEIKAGIQHIAQWGGTSPRHGELPDKFSDYLRILTALEGDERATIGDQIYVLGNHLGGHELYFTKNFQNFKIQLFYNHIFEDNSGLILSNTPDGRYGIYYETKEDHQLINSVIYEFYYTHHQSHTTTGAHKYDNYFFHGTYLSGWTYRGKVIGSPFFTRDPDGIEIINNKFSAHHIGVSGQIGRYINIFPYKLLLSYAHNDGRYVKRFRPKQHVFYALYEVQVLKSTIELNVQLGAEYDNYKSPIYGAGLHIVYKL